MSYKRPGVYLNEVLLPQAEVPVSATADSFATIVAPANRGPVEATLVRSWNEFTKNYGSFDQTPNLAYAVYQYFRNGGGPAYIQRVEGTGAANATRTLKDRAAVPVDTLKVDAANSGAWANGSTGGVSIGITDGETGRFNVLVYSGGTTGADIVEVWNDLSLTAGDERYVESVVNHPLNGSTYITVTDLNSATAGNDALPAVGVSALASGADGTAPTAAVKQGVFAVDGTSPLDDILQPVDLYLPGESDSTVLNEAIDYAEWRDRAFVVIDTGANIDVATAKTFVSGLTASSRAAVYYPHVWVPDPGSKKSDALKKVGPGASVLGKYSQTDRRKGPWKPAAGLSTEVAGGVELERKLTNSDLDELNVAHINAIRNIPGNGLRIMGARTLKKREADKYVSVRRTLSYIKEGLKDVSEFAAFEPNDADLWNRLRAACNGFLSGVQGQGGLVSGDPAFYVKCDADNNPQSSVDQGQVNIEVGVALLQPAEFVVITVSQFQGGSATTSEQ